MCYLASINHFKYDFIKRCIRSFSDTNSLVVQMISCVCHEHLLLERCMLEQMKNVLFSNYFAERYNRWPGLYEYAHRRVFVQRNTSHTVRKPCSIHTFKQHNSVAVWIIFHIMCISCCENVDFFFSLVRIFSSVSMVALWEVLLPYSSRVPSWILCSGYCLYGDSLVLLRFSGFISPPKNTLVGGLGTRNCPLMRMCVWCQMIDYCLAPSVTGIDSGSTGWNAYRRWMNDENF